MKLKRIVPVIVSIVMILAFALSGCSSSDDRNSQLRQEMNDVASALTETFGTETCDFNLLREYIQAWAKDNNLKVKKNDETYMVLSNPATKGHKDADSTTLQCSVNTANTKNSMYVLSASMAALLGPEEHGTINLIITEAANSNHMGAQEVADKFVKGDRFINLQGSGDTKVFTEGAYAATANITSKLKKKESRYTECYTITMSMPEYTDPFNFDKKNNYPNPIQVIGSLLATTKSSGKLFDIASFECKSNKGYTPYTASVTVVIDKNNVESFKKKFDKSYSNIEEKFEKLDDVFVYSMTEAEAPEKVLSEKTTNNLISLMYTLNTGICLQDEESGVVNAESYIDSIKTSDGKLKLSINIRARNEESIQELGDMYEITAGLCSTKCKVGDISKVWSSSEKNTELADYFTQFLSEEDAENTSILKTLDNDFLAAKNPKINMITYSFSNSGRDEGLANIVNFLDAGDTE